MPSNTNPFNAWASAKGFLNETQDDSSVKEAELLMLCSEVTPSQDSEELFTSLVNTLKFAAANDLTDFAPLRNLMVDKRLPTWARLTVAIDLGDSKLMKALSKAVPMLAKQLRKQESFYSWPLSTASFKEFSLEDRIALANSGLSDGTSKFTIDEIMTALKDPLFKNSGVSPYLLNGGVAWGDDLLENITNLQTIAELAKFRPLETFNIALDFFKGESRPGTSTKDLQAALDIITSMLSKVERRFWPHSYNDWPADTEVVTLLLAPGASREPANLQLAGYFSHSKLPISLTKELVNSTSYWAVPLALVGASSTDILEVLALYPGDIPDKNASFNVVHALAYSDFAWLTHPDAEKIYLAQPKGYAGYALKKAIEDIANYPKSSEPSADFNLIPKWVLEIISNGLTELESGSHQPARLAEVHAYLISQAYVPVATKPLPAYYDTLYHNGQDGVTVVTEPVMYYETDDAEPEYFTKPSIDFVYEALSEIFLKEDLGTATEASLASARAWVERMDATEIANLITYSLEFKNEHGGNQEIPSVITETIEAAIALCKFESAQTILISTLANPPVKKEPRMTLSAFAKKLSRTVKKSQA